MRAVLRFLGSRWFLTFIGVALLAALVWLFGPFLPYLEDWIPRAAAIAVMALIWLVINVWLIVAAGRTRPPWSQGVTAAQVDPSVAASAEEVAALQDKLTTALGAAEARIRLTRLSLRAAVVRDHRPARRRQDHRAAERRPRPSRSPPRWGRARSPASAARASATGGSPRARC